MRQPGGPRTAFMSGAAISAVSTRRTRGRRSPRSSRLSSSRMRRNSPRCRTLRMIIQPILYAVTVQLSSSDWRRAPEDCAAFWRDATGGRSASLAKRVVVNNTPLALPQNCPPAELRRSRAVVAPRPTCCCSCCCSCCPLLPSRPTAAPEIL